MHHVDEQIQDAIKKIVSSHDSLATMNYKKAQLGTIFAQWTVIYETMRKIASSIESSGSSNDTDQRILRHARRYSQSYDFGRELDTIANLYAGDSDRLRSIALKIVESLEEKGLILFFCDVVNV